ncbi:UDP-N-acetylmuramoyl-tripeptide--D-alanyl-D-alanine ligase [Thiomicrorhabdus hydrogeniphila]
MMTQITATETSEQLVENLQNQLNGNNDVSAINKETNMFFWTLEQLCESTDGDRIGPISDTVKFTSISTDTRTLQPGALYIAIKGENFDGHVFIDKAIQQGAVAVLVSDDIDVIVPGVQVADTRVALGEFARWHRLQMPVETLIAVTGSNGKTTTKSLLQNIFSNVGNTLATEGNLNNDFGVPRTLLNLRPEHQFAIIEMGANHQHEITYLTALALPDIAMINNASGAHLEGFGSLQGVIKAKGEIFEGLNKIPGRKPGVAILNTDTNGYKDWLFSLEKMNVKNVISFGTAKNAQVKLANFTTANNQVNQASQNKEDSLSIAFDLIINGNNKDVAVHRVQMPVLGLHNAMNAAGCTAIALAAGLNWNQILPGLVNFTGVAGRLQKTRINHGWLIDDSYNANPESVKAGIDALVSLPGLAILCLGAMAEIGKTSQQVHQQIAEYAKIKGIKYLFVFGEAAKNMPNVFGENAHYFETHSALANHLLAILSQPDNQQKAMNILVKGSRSAKMEMVVQNILQSVKKTDSSN